MRTDKDALLFQERVQRFIETRGWWTFAQVTGLLMGALVILYSGFIPWYEVTGWRDLEYDGLSLMRGRLAFSLGGVIALSGMVRICRSDDRVRVGSAVLASCSAAAVVMAALIELDQFDVLAFDTRATLSGLPLYEARHGAYVAMAGGAIAFVCSLFGLIPDRRSPDMTAHVDVHLLRDPLQNIVNMGWGTFLQSFGLVVGALLILLGGVTPWLGFSEGIDLVRGRITFGLGAFIGVLGLLRVYSDDDRIRNGSAMFGAWAATAVLTLAFYELDRIRPLTDPYMLSFYVATIGAGIYYTIVGGFFAFFGSLFRIVPDRSSSERET
ncbi:MAG: hypothetical protein WD939_00500 [Dehalococcoidia bacterium]